MVLAPMCLAVPASVLFRLSMFTFLLVLQAIVGAALVTVILMQRSEGGGLGMGGSPSGLMSARGAADFLSRATAVPAGLFVLLSIGLATLAATRHSTTIARKRVVSGKRDAVRVGLGGRRIIKKKQNERT